MDEPKSAEAAPLVELIELVLQGTASHDERQQLQARLAASPEDRKAYLHHLNLHSALRRQFAFDGEEEIPAQLDLASREQTSEAKPRRAKPWLAGWSWAAVAAAVVVAIGALYFQRPIAERPIARITGLSGPLAWTGDGGQVSYDLSVGAELPGGTVEGMAPRSWLELTFNDGSTVTISGNSTLTVSDHGQKELHLKEGSLSSNVSRQPAGKPMLVYTRSAMLEVLGTQFDVQAGLAATMLNVSKGTVRIKRLSDDKLVDVHARQRVTAAADREMSPVPIPDTVSRWKSQLHLGPAGSQGRWSPGTKTRDARLRAIPYTTPQGDTIYTAGFGVSHGERPPVVLQDASSFRVRGRIALPRNVYLGVTVRRSDGEFAGRFQSVRPAIEFRSGRDFEVTLQFRDFRLDPSLAEMKSQLPSEPFDLVVDSLWFHTLNEQAGLEICEAELLSPKDPALPRTSTSEPRQQPVIDIWTAASQGNLGAVRHHLAAGADIDATVVAPGIPASGATPLHLAVFTDQREVAEFLIEKGADLGAKAKDEYGGAPLHWAAALGRIGMAKRLIAAGADINAPDNHGFTPLDATGYAPQHEAEAKGEIAEFLREKGGKKREEPQDGESPLGDNSTEEARPS